MTKKVVYPGTFDPITNGHLDVIKRASAIFDEVIVAISINHEKKPMFLLEERIEMVRLATADLSNVKVASFESLLVDFLQRQNAKIIVRGLRALSDFEYELQMGYANESLDATIETIYLMPSLQYAFVSSSVVRSILKYNGKIDHLVPQQALDLIKRKS